MDRWIFSFGVFAVVTIAVIISSPWLLAQNQQFIIETINNATRISTEEVAESTRIREEQFQQQKIAILNNISNKLDENAERLEALIESQNVTVTLDRNATIQLEESGKVSGIGKPKIVEIE